MKKITLWILSFLLLTAPLLADEKQPPQNFIQKREWPFGAGLLSVDQPYKGLKNRFVPIPLVAYRGPRLQVDGIRATYALLLINKFSAGALLRYRFAGYDPDKSDFLRGMDKRADTLEAGAFARWKLPKDYSLSAALAADIQNHSNGTEFTIGGDKMFRFKKLMVGPTLEFKFLDSDLADYYYGVRLEESTAERPFTQVQSAMNIIPGIAGRYIFSPRTMAMIFFNQEYLDTEIRNSPIISKKKINRVFAGLLYKF